VDARVRCVSAPKFPSFFPTLWAACGSSRTALCSSVDNARKRSHAGPCCPERDDHCPVRINLRMSTKKSNPPIKTNANGRLSVTGEGRGKGGGRPELEIDPKVVAGMAFVGGTNIEIAEFLGCSVDVLERRFADVLRKKRASIRLRLRRAQLRLAMEGNATMLIWLGKQYLGQSDHPVPADSSPPQERQSIVIGGQKIFF